MTASHLKILFLTPPEEDYLAVTLFHGLRSRFGEHVVDFPKFDVVYQSYPTAARPTVYGRGFSVFFDLPDVDIDRSAIEARWAAGEFDLVVVADIWRQFDLFARWRSRFNPTSTVLVDGHDSPSVYPHAGRWWRKPLQFLSLPRANARFLYFKREWNERSQFNIWHRLLPRSMRSAIPSYRGLRRISFSFIERKIIHTEPKKTKTFPRHIVDPEVSGLVPGSATVYAFDSEPAYYADLQASRFGITTKRSGWDCLRHYEIAANGAVPCFRMLEDKADTCAPHGLIPGVNCLSYRRASDLIQLAERIDSETYRRLQQGALNWVRSMTTVCVADHFVASWREWADSLGLQRG